MAHFLLLISLILFDIPQVNTQTLGIVVLYLICAVLYHYIVYVTSFFSIPYYSNVRLVSKIELEQDLQSIAWDVHASTNKCPLKIFYKTAPNTMNYINNTKKLDLFQMKPKWDNIPISQVK